MTLGLAKSKVVALLLSITLFCIQACSYYSYNTTLEMASPLLRCEAAQQ